MTQYARWVGSNGIVHTGRVQHGRLQDIPGDPQIVDLLAMPDPPRRELDLRAGRQQKLPIRDAILAVPVQPARILRLDRNPRESSDFETRLAPSGGDISVSSETGVVEVEVGLGIVVRLLSDEGSAGAIAPAIAGLCIVAWWSAEPDRRQSGPGGDMAGTGDVITVGPWITTLDEVAAFRDGDRYIFMASIAVEGVEPGASAAQDATIRMSHIVPPVPKGVASKDVLIVLGGEALDAPLRRTVRADETVSITVQALGTIRNRVVAPQRSGETATRSSPDQR